MNQVMALFKQIGKGVNWAFSFVLLALITIYRHTLSAFIGRTCRHLPTCSQYARDSILKHGAWAGFWLGISRWFRCSPWGTHGFDPAPDELPKNARWFLPWRYGQWRKSNETMDN